jgi:adenosylcobinamide-GDP ribazoletransferase
VLTGRVSVLGSLAGCGLAVGLAALLLGWDGLIAAGAVGATAAIAAVVWRVWLGGVTGDTLGATIQLAEVTALVTLLALR